MMGFLWFCLIGIAAGWLAGQIMKGSGFGLIGNLIVGLIGALLGGVLFRALDLNVGGSMGELVAATVGAILLLFLLQVFRRKA